MKILFISDYYPPYVKAGAEVSTSLLASWLAQHNNVVSVACSKFSNDPWIENGVTVYPIIFKPHAGSGNFLSALWDAFIIIVQQFNSTIRVLKLIRKLDPDIINAVTYSRLHPIIIGIRIFSKRPIIVDCRSYDLICPADLSPTYMGAKKDFDEEVQSRHGYRCIGYGSASDPSFFSIRPFAIYESFFFNLYKLFLRFLINHFNGTMLVGVSQYIQRQLILNGFNAEKTAVIYNISRPVGKRFSHTGSSMIPTFAYGGRLEEGKGIWDLVAAAEILQRQLKQPFSLKIAGTGSEMGNLEKYIKDHHIECITLLGHIKPDEVLTLYEQSIAIIGPSRTPEPFGRFILDAITVGKPLIATRAGGITEGVEDGITGVLVDVGNAEQLAAAMRSFVENPERSAAMKDAIMSRQEYYAADFIGKQRLGLYEDLLGNSYGNAKLKIIQEK